MKVAALDVGSNSIHLLIARILPDHSWEVIYRDKAMVRLGSRSFGRDGLAEAAQKRGLTALERYAEVIRKFEADQVIAIATSAVREAKNGSEFVKKVRDATGLKIDRISGSEEARLVAAAVSTAPGFDRGRHLVIDIGGGSTELAFLENQVPLELKSHKLGCVRFSEEFPVKNTPGRKGMKELRRLTHTRMAPVLLPLRNRRFDRVAGTSGTIVCLGTLAAARERQELSRGATIAVQRSSIARELNHLAELSLDERRSYLGDQASRADVILHGGAILMEILESLDNEEISIPDRSIRDGMLVDFIRQRVETTAEDHTTNLARMAGSRRERRYDPHHVREQAILAFARRYQYDAGHAHQVMRIAAQLFDATKRVHGFGSEEKFFLEAAALLHDIGQHIAYSQHHKHSLYLIQHSGLSGFHEREIQIIGNIARYHRKAFPSLEHPEYAQLSPEDRKVVDGLSALLRIADGLDYGHLSAVSRLRVNLGARKARIHLTGPRDMSSESQRALAKADLFEKVYGLMVGFSARRSPGSRIGSGVGARSSAGVPAR